jgi:hypothetical protein
MMKLLITLILMGVVDSVDNDIVTAEVQINTRVQKVLHFPVEMFPCDLTEGDYFYVKYVDGDVEGICGLPPQLEEKLWFLP